MAAAGRTDEFGRGKAVEDLRAKGLVPFEADATGGKRIVNGLIDRYITLPRAQLLERAEISIAYFDGRIYAGTDEDLAVRTGDNSYSALNVSRFGILSMAQTPNGLIAVERFDPHRTRLEAFRRELKEHGTLPACSRCCGIR